MRNKMTGAKTLFLTMCAVGVLTATTPTWAAGSVTNCAQVSTTNEKDIDSTPGNQPNDQAIIDALAQTPPGNEDDEACAKLDITSVYDFGDAPISYGTNGTTAARHEIISGLMLGTSIDDELDGQASDNADGDGTDEDGVNMPSLVDGSALELNVTVTNTTTKDSFIGCWIDYNKDGKFATDGSEYGGASVPKGISGGLVKVTMPSVPATASVDTKGSTYARCRLSSDLIDASKANGSLTDGEVEDYNVTITANPIFDLALRKRVDTTATPAKIKAGDTVKYTIEVINQGNVDATDVVVTDYIPSDMTVADTNWTDNKDGTATLTTPLATVAKGTTQTITITLQVKATAVAGKVTNTAEISSAKGGTDVDSTPDANVGNEPKVVDDEVNGKGGTEDEDDHDIAEITIDPAVDIKLAKSIEDNTGAPVTTSRHGDEVVYVLTVTNEGKDMATGVTVNDLLPTGLVYVSDNSGSAYSHQTGAWTVGDLAAGTSKTIKITAKVN
jgi:uncharacterized repeat protein (TIGR01451 family)